MNMRQARSGSVTVKLETLNPNFKIVLEFATARSISFPLWCNMHGNRDI